MDETIGGRLQLLRVEGGWSRADVAGTLGLSERTVARLEAGWLRPSRFELGLLADRFGWDAAELVELERRTRRAAQVTSPPVSRWARGEWARSAVPAPAAAGPA